MVNHNDMNGRRTYYVSMWCAICGSHFKAARRHAFLCSSGCRKKFSRLTQEEKDKIKGDLCETSWKPKNVKRRKKNSGPTSTP